MFLLIFTLLFASLTSEACLPVYRALDEFGRSEPRGFYPLILEARQSGHLKVSELHEIYWEEVGNPNGVPVVFLHGGPGAGINGSHRRFFDPAKYRIILMDQRGSGKSRPSGELRENTTAELVGDIEKLRGFLEIETWHVFGGSWGSTLGVAYAEAHPEKCRSLILRGVFLGRPHEISWLYDQNGAGRYFPAQWKELASVAPSSEEGDILGYLAASLQSRNPDVRYAAIIAMSRWEATLANATMPNAPPQPAFYTMGDMKQRMPNVLIELHYFTNGAFLKDNQLLKNAHRLAGIPGVIIQGDHDYITPPASARELHEAWPGSRLVMVAGAGHPAGDPRMIDALVRATDDVVDLP